MTFRILNENKTLYIIPCGFILLDVLMRFLGAETTRLPGTLFILSIFAALAYNHIPTRIFLDEKELRINHIFIRKIGIDAIERIRLEEYTTRSKRLRKNKVRCYIVYRRKGETRELLLNDDRFQLTLFGKSTGKSSALYDLHNYLKSYISKDKAADFSEN